MKYYFKCLFVLFCFMQKMYAAQQPDPAKNPAAPSVKAVLENAHRKVPTETLSVLTHEEIEEWKKVYESLSNDPMIKEIFKHVQPSLSAYLEFKENEKKAMLEMRAKKDAAQDK